MGAKEKFREGRDPSRVSRSDNSSLPPSSCTLAIKAVPNAPRNEVVGWLGGALKIKLHAPPVEGRANEVLCEFLAETLNLPRRAVTMLRGETSRQKVIHIAGLGFDAVKARLIE